MEKVKTTLMLPRESLRAAKQAALNLNLSLSAYVDSLILGKDRQPRKPRRIRLHTCGKGGLLPGVDITSNESIQGLLDEKEGRWSSLI